VIKDDLIPGKWYVIVPPIAPSLKPDQTFIGPFDSQDEAEEHLKTHFSGGAVMKIEIPPITTLD
jgi:hypothetical protein